jgi:hypothetical protein
MRYQVVVLDEEIGGATTIDGLSWQKSPYGATTGTFNQFRIYMGYCASDELGTVFDANYISGTKTMVHYASSVTLSAAPEGWDTINLNTPFEYDGSENLIIEIQWTGGTGSFYEYVFDGGPNRCLKASTASSTTGIILSRLFMVELEWPTAFERDTFGSIKTFFDTL